MRNNYLSLVIVLSILFSALVVSTLSRAAPPDRSQERLLQPSARLKSPAGGLEPGAPPTSTYSFTLQDIYNRLASGTAGSQITFAEPPSGPIAGTGHTLNEIMALAPAADDVHGAGAAEVLTGTTVWGLTSGAWGTLTGTMPDRGTVVITPATVSQTIAAGYHDGSGYVQGDMDLVAGNIKYNVNIYGITGTHVGEAPYPAPVPKTGQTDCYKSAEPWGTCTCGTADCPSGQDGDLEKGVAWPSPRFITSTTGVVTDTLTGLVWLQNANCSSFFSGDSTGHNARLWADALPAANLLASGYCDLTDGSSAGDWRLPNVRELQSLIDYGRYNPALPSGHPFTGVQSSHYWSATTYASNTSGAWLVDLYYGIVNLDVKTNSYYVWPVRGGQ